MFRKSRYHAPPGFFAAEASGLAWLAVPDGVPVASVHAVGDDFVELTPLVSVAPTPSAAEEFGRRLAVTHDAGADAFGVPPEGYHGPGWIGDAPLNYGHHQRWGAFYAAERIQPYQAIVEKTATVPAETIAGLDRLCERLDAGHWDDTAPPARLHGDLWNGNLLFTADGATLIDPAAHGGHRLTDLAMLALFGAPHLDRILDAYAEASAVLPDGWRDLLPLHQLHPLLVHSVLFGAGYGAQLALVVRRLVG
ncbi:MAG: fructosamine kinase family protein [Micropruina sp.]|nr:fructosamine kinase family protein [Micropruina sp.]